MSRFQIRSGGHGLAVVEADTDAEALLIFAGSLTADEDGQRWMRPASGKVTVEQHAVLELDGERYTAERAS